MNNINTEKLDKLPDEVLTDITAPVDSLLNTLNPADLINDPNNKAKIDIPSPTPSSGNSGPTVTVNNTGAKPVKVGGIVGGKFIVDTADTLLPAIAVYISLAFSYKIDKKLLQLTQKEKDLIVPAMQDYLDSVNINFNNPGYNLLFVVGSVYVAKIIEAIPSAEKVKKDAPKKPAIVVAIEKSKENAEENVKRKRQKGLFIEQLNKETDVNIQLSMIISRLKMSKAKAEEWYRANKIKTAK
ncbi:MAG TPA: hypothetical protein VF487_13235 [Chitinophagaceae bacterium]